MTRFLTTTSGQIIAYEERGNPRDSSIFFFHGTPGSHRQLDLLPSALLENLHWICVDRPGYGETSPSLGFNMNDATAAISACADHLGLDRFQVLGFSGGGPYALACAYTIPDRAYTAHLVSSLGPVDIPEIWSLLRRQDRLLFLLARRCPPLFRWALRMSMRGIPKNPERFLGQLASKMSTSDQALLADPDMLAQLSGDLREALHQGTVGMADDLMTLSQPWPFLLKDIQVPVHVWHGAHDQVINPQIGANVAARIQLAQYHQPENGAHMVLWTHATEIREVIDQMVRRVNC
jgi:pimeloyl-ACP methyl ester carboxylesterase